MFNISMFFRASRLAAVSFVVVDPNGERAYSHVGGEATSNGARSRPFKAQPRCDQLHVMSAHRRHAVHAHRLGVAPVPAGHRRVVVAGLVRQAHLLECVAAATSSSGTRTALEDKIKRRRDVRFRVPW